MKKSIFSQVTIYPSSDFSLLNLKINKRRKKKKRKNEKEKDFLPTPSFAKPK